MPKKTPIRIIDTRKANRATTISGVTLTAPPSGVSDHGLLLGLGDDDHPQYLLADGTRSLTGNLSVASGVTIDGVDISAHAGDPAAHHAPVTAGTLISVLGQQVGITTGANYQFIGTGSDTIPEWRNVSELAGNGLTATNGVLAVGVSGLGLSVSADAVTLTSSSNPGAAASILASNSSGYLQLVRLGLGKSPTVPLDVSGGAAISGALSAGSANISGSATVIGDLSVGTVLQVNTAGTRVGINRAADQQFDLDVAGAIRGQYLVGKHAIQLASAVGVWHYDGPAPYNLDFGGSNASHAGVGGTESGGVIYRPGKFGKSVQIAPATTNLLTNPSFETNTAGWGTDYSATTTLTRTAGGLYGNYFLAVAATGTGNFYSPPVTVANATAYAVSFWYRTTSSVSVYVREYGNATNYGTATLPAATEWTRYTISLTTPASASTVIRLVFSNLSGGDSIDIDGVQVEQKAYATPYCDGSLGTGHSWSGTPHASTSSRTGATLTYANNAGLNSDEGSIMMWARHAGMATGGMGLWGTGSNAQFDAYVNQVGSIYFRQSNTYQSFGAGIQPQTWNHYAFTWSKSANTRKIFVNGVEVSSRQFDAGATLGSVLYVGSLSAGASYSANGLVDEFIILDYAADPKLIRAIYESDAPVFVESSVFHWRSPSRVPIWVDEFGLWARGVSGNEILGLYGGDPRDPTGNVTRSWGGITMEENDIVIGRAAQAAVHWDDSAGTLLIGRPNAGNLLLSGGALRLRNGTTDRVVIDSAGNASFTGAITASSGSITGALTLGGSGGIYQGSGTFASPTTGLKIWNDGGIGRIGGYDAGTLQWYAGTNGYLYSGAGKAAMMQYGILLQSENFASGGSWPHNVVGVHAVANVSAPTGNYRGSLMFGTPPGVYANSPRVWFLHYPGTLPAVTPVGGGASLPTALMISDDSGNGPWVVWHAGNDGHLSELDADLLDGRHASEFALLTGAVFSGAITLQEMSTTPANPTSGTQTRMYMKADKLVIQFNDGGTVRYKYLNLTGTGVTWVHTTTPP